jgi:hypothetical protein
VDTSALTYLSQFVNWGALGGVLFLIIAGMLVPKRAHEDTKAEAANWRAAYDDERKAHQATRDALVLANERTEAAVEAAKLTRMLLEEARRDPGGGPRAIQA